MVDMMQVMAAMMKSCTKETIGYELYSKQQPPMKGRVSVMNENIVSCSLCSEHCSVRPICAFSFTISFRSPYGGDEGQIEGCRIKASPHKYCEVTNEIVYRTKMILEHPIMYCAPSIAYNFTKNSLDHIYNSSRFVQACGLFPSNYSVKNTNQQSNEFCNKRIYRFIFESMTVLNTNP